MMCSLKAGWAEVDITPGGKVFLIGQLYARVSEGIMDPVTATALAFESGGNDIPAGHAVMVSCDLVAIPDALRDRVRSALGEGVPGLDPKNVFLSATHTHSAPHIRIEEGSGGPEPYGIKLDAMPPAEYVDFAAEKIAEAVRRAWAKRRTAGIGYGIGHAVVGRNRRLSYRGGESVMYGKSSDSGFMHVEGYEDHSVSVMAVYGVEDVLTGVVVNVPCPSQVSESSYKISADFWHETRMELRKRFGRDLSILAQCAPSGDQAPHVLINRRAEERMWRLKGRDVSQDAPRSEIAERIADAVGEVLRYAGKEIDRSPAFSFTREIVHLPRRKITEDDVIDADSRADGHRERYKELFEEIRKNPAVKEQPRWYLQITSEYSMMRWFERVRKRFESQKKSPLFPAEINALIIGGTAFASNPFELYLDYGIRMRELCPQTQTFLIQLSGPGGYLPSLRSVCSGGYGSVPASTEVGPEGGEVLIERTVDMIKELMEGKREARPD